MNINSIRKFGITNIGDPYVLRVGEDYFMYATSFIDGFNCWQSKDLVNWSAPKQVYKRGERSFGYMDFWAPEVVELDGKFVMHYTARRKSDDTLLIGVAISDSPMGDFIDVYDKAPMFDFGFAVIDGHVFKDEGKNYFYYDRDCSQHIVDNRNESHIFMVELDDTLTKVISKPILVITPSQEWETVTGDTRWNEGAFVVKKDGYYYMMYSAGFYAASTYSTGYAVAKSPKGPFIKSNSNPILYSVDNVISGPGHNCIVNDEKGNSFCVFHTHTDMTNPSENRQACICPIKFEGGEIILP